MTGQLHSDVAQLLPRLPSMSMDMVPPLEFTQQKYPATTMVFGCYWIVLDDEMVEGRGIEPPTSTLRTLRSPN